MASIIDYEESVQVSKDDPSFAALIWAAMRKADTDNLALLREAFPDLCAEFERRYNGPGGYLLPEEQQAFDDAVAAHRNRR